MEVITLSQTNFIGLTSDYTYDKTLKFDQDVIITEQGMNIPVVKAFNSLPDVTRNNYSNLLLTQTTPLSSSIYIEDLEPIPEQFTTYLAANAIGGITDDEARFMVVEEPDYTISLANVAMTGRYAAIDNRYFFTVVFLDEQLCKIKHVNNNIERYLTLGSSDNFYFTFDLNTDYLGDTNPQAFYYMYDRAGEFIILSKNIQDLNYYVGYVPLSGDGLTLVETMSANFTPELSGSYIPYTSNAIFKCAPRTEIPNNTKLYDPWVSYKKDFKTNTQDIDSDRSYSNIKTNTLINNEYMSLTGSTLNTNILSLKNTNTPENYQSRNNPYQANKSQYFSETDVEFREYKKIFSGSNQTLGNDNITLGYESYTTGIVLPKDKVTYFHVPYSIFPFIQLNINDSGLIEAGAIAGDHPIKADKIFKKQADAEYTSPFGSASDESNGTFLCSWLSGSTDLTVKPMWVDRYYNPSKITYITALTSQTLKAISYSTVFENLVTKAGYIPGLDDVFDKPSDLTFEPGCYYAYHHYGPVDVNKYISIFTPNRVQKGLLNYQYTNNAPSYPSDTNEYVFDGSRYATTNPLSAIQESNQFTVCFDMYNLDWTKPFGYQILGNFLNDGFGIFNENVVTPTLTIKTSNGIDIYNTEAVKIKSVNYGIPVRSVIRTDVAENYTTIDTNGIVRRYTCDDLLINTNSTQKTKLSGTIDVDNTATTAYALYIQNNTFTLSGIASINLDTNKITTAPTSAVVMVPSNTWVASAAKINFYKDKFYITPGIVSRRVKNNIYYLTDNSYTIKKWEDIEASNASVVTLQLTAFKSQQPINDFNIDYDGNIWITRDRQFYKYTQNREFLLSGSITSDTQVTNTVVVTGNNGTKTFTITNSGSPVASDYVVTDTTNGTLAPIFDYTITNNTSSITFTTPPLSGSVISITRSYGIDTYTTQKIDFIAEFINGKYNDRVIFTRVSNNSDNYQLAQFTMDGQPAVTFSNRSLTSVFVSSVPYTPTQQVLINNDYLREYIQDTYPASNLNIKAVTRNVFNPLEQQSNEIIFNLSALDTGYHNFAIRFDAYQGYMSLFIDGQNVENVQFQPRKYKFSNLIYRPWLVGSACFNNSTPLYQYLQNNSYLAENIKIKNFYLYSIPLDDYDIIMHSREGYIIHDIHFDIACGRRNYTEEIERYFKANTPGAKSTLYNIILRNTGVTDPAVQTELEKRILQTLKATAPVYAQLNKIKWVN